MRHVTIVLMTQTQIICPKAFTLLTGLEAETLRVKSHWIAGVLPLSPGSNKATSEISHDVNLVIAIGIHVWACSQAHIHDEF